AREKQARLQIPLGGAGLPAAIRTSCCFESRCGTGLGRRQGRRGIRTGRQEWRHAGDQARVEQTVQMEAGTVAADRHRERREKTAARLHQRGRLRHHARSTALSGAADPRRRCAALRCNQWIAEVRETQAETGEEAVAGVSVGGQVIHRAAADCCKSAILRWCDARNGRSTKCCESQLTRRIGGVTIKAVCSIAAESPVASRSKCCATSSSG